MNKLLVVMVVLVVSVFAQDSTKKIYGCLTYDTQKIGIGVVYDISGHPLKLGIGLSLDLKDRENLRYLAIYGKGQKNWNVREKATNMEMSIIYNKGYFFVMAGTELSISEQWIDDVNRNWEPKDVRVYSRAGVGIIFYEYLFGIGYYHTELKMYLGYGFN